MMVGRIGEQICGRNGVSSPNDLTGLEVPPHIRIIEPLLNR